MAGKKKNVAIGATVLLSVSLSCLGTALAGVPKRYVLNHPGREHCRAHYVERHIERKRRVHGRTVKLHVTVCVRKVPKQPVRRATGAVKLKAKLDPSFKQSPTDPLAVTYRYSATATETVKGDTVSKTDLPNGVLNLYSDGLLVCSKPVGGGVTGGECAVTYGAFGSHVVIVTYYAGTLAGTVTEVEHIQPFSTQTTLRLSGPRECANTMGGVEMESCTYTAELATVDQNGNLPQERSVSLLFERLPEEEFTPGISPSDLRIPGGFFGGPVSFVLERQHGPEGWRCAVRSGSYTDWFEPLPGMWNPYECGTSVTAYGKYEGTLWMSSKSAQYPVIF